MTWTLSRFRAGALVEVRNKEEILATLDEHGCVDGLPFMPEMLVFCGQRLQVRAVAHKTCETVRRTWRGRRLAATVHLGDLYCDGAAHGGCQAACTLFWKDVWLKPADNDGEALQASAVKLTTNTYTEARLFADTQAHATPSGDEPCYSCQTTRLYEATEPLPWWDLRQYVFDVLTGNHSAAPVLQRLWLAALRAALRRTPVAWSLVKAFRDRNHLWLTGLPTPEIDGKVPPGTKTPSGRLDLAPGDWVRIKSQPEIAETVDQRGKNRGLSFDPNEMAPYCGRVVQVRRSVTQIIDELTGKMIYMKQPCIMLEGVTCNGINSAHRLNCPRKTSSYWRELWLERVEPEK